jgi:ATP-dependent Clp protease ATP-binding subunit ClpA
MKKNSTQKASRRHRGVEKDSGREPPRRRRRGNAPSRRRMDRYSLSKMEEAESKKLLKLEAELQSEVIGQTIATEVISKALRRSRADLKDPKRPIGSFMFLGPTGVGKTLLAKVLAEEMFGDKDAIIQIDMSEYMEKFAVSRLVGSPPGYVGTKRAVN